MAINVVTVVFNCISFVVDSIILLSLLEIQSQTRATVCFSCLPNLWETNHTFYFSRQKTTVVNHQKYEHSCFPPNFEESKRCDMLPSTCRTSASDRTTSTTRVTAIELLTILTDSFLRSTQKQVHICFSHTVQYIFWNYLPGHISQWKRRLNSYIQFVAGFVRAKRALEVLFAARIVAG